MLFWIGGFDDPAGERDSRNQPKNEGWNAKRLTETREMQKRSSLLTAPQAFSLKATSLSHGWHECSPMSWSEGGRCFQIMERDNDDVFRVSVVESSRRKCATELAVIVEGDSVPDDVMNRILDRVGIVFRLDQDIRKFHEICADDPVLWVIPLIGAGRGLRSASMTENIIKALCSTNVTWSQAVKMINRIGQLGPTFRHFVNLNAWPTPREILRAGERYLTEVCRVGYRCESILKFCQDVRDGKIDPDEFDKLAASPEVSSEEILAKLRSIRGIGPSSAHYLLSFLGRHDHLSIDSATVAHVARTHTKGRKPSLKRIEKIYERYGKWKNLCWWYEHWLTWETGKQIVQEANLGSVKKREGQRTKRRLG